jgi:hypothetical protein
MPVYFQLLLVTLIEHSSAQADINLAASCSICECVTTYQIQSQFVTKAYFLKQLQSIICAGKTFPCPTLLEFGEKC